MKFFKTPTVVPPGGGWWWEHPETGHRVRGGNAEQLLINAREYCRLNHFPIGLGFDDRIIESVCARQPEICDSSEPPTLSEQAGTFLRAAKRWMDAGLPVLPHEDYNARFQVCKGCERWHGEAIFGLGRCGKCGCSGLKLYLPTERCPLNKWPL